MTLYSARAYTHSPVWLQQVLLSLRSGMQTYLRGRGSESDVADLIAAEFMDSDALAAMQLERTRATLVHAARNVPFYRSRFRAVGFDPADLKSISDVAKLPYLSKSEVIAAGDTMLAENHRGLRFSTSSSGTTGVPLTAWRDLKCVRRESSFVWRQLRWAGLQPGDRRVWLRGDKIVPAVQREPPYWRHVATARMLMMSSYHLGESTARAYLDAMARFDPAGVQAYPSSILLLARFLVDRGKRYQGRSLRAVVTSSETITDEHRRCIEQAFGCRLFDFYGSMERVVCIGTCEHGRYHLMPDYSYAEFAPDEQGNLEAVGTSFDNDLMPWVRYRVGDVIVPAAPGTVCACGRAFPVIDRIVGRIEDSIVTSDGRHVFMASNILDYVPHLLQGQIHQERPGEVRVLLVMNPGTRVDVPLVERAAKNYLGDQMRVRVEQVESLPRTPNGKLQMVVRSGILPPRTAD